MAMGYVALACACTFAGAAHADELESPTLRKIRDTGTIVIGVRRARKRAGARKRDAAHGEERAGHAAAPRVPTRLSGVA